MSDALSILEKRLVSGEISAAEFDTLKAKLEHEPPSSEQGMKEEESTVTDEATTKTARFFTVVAIGAIVLFYFVGQKMPSVSGDYVWENRAAQQKYFNPDFKDKWVACFDSRIDVGPIDAILITIGLREASYNTLVNAVTINCQEQLKRSYPNEWNRNAKIRR